MRRRLGIVLACTAAAAVVVLSSAVGASAGPAKRAVTTTVKQESAELLPDPSGGDRILLTGNLRARANRCERGRTVRVKYAFEDFVNVLGSDVTNSKGKFEIEFGFEFPDGEPSAATVSRKRIKGGPTCKAGSSTFDPEPVDSQTTFDYNGDTTSFSGVVSSDEPGCLAQREWELRKNLVSTFTGTTEAGTGAWSSPSDPSPAGEWRLRISGAGLDSEPLADGGLEWSYCHVLNGIKNVAP